MMAAGRALRNTAENVLSRIMLVVITVIQPPRNILQMLFKGSHIILYMLGGHSTNQNMQPKSEVIFTFKSFRTGKQTCLECYCNQKGNIQKSKIVRWDTSAT